MPVVNVKGMGEVTFPDSMSPDQIKAALDEKFAAPAAADTPAAVVPPQTTSDDYNAVPHDPLELAAHNYQAGLEMARRNPDLAKKWAIAAEGQKTAGGVLLDDLGNAVTRGILKGFGTVSKAAGELLEPSAVYTVQKDANGEPQYVLDSPAKWLDRAKANPDYRFGQNLQDTAARQDEPADSMLNKVAEGAGELLPVAASGPAAPATIGLEAYADALDHRYAKSLAHGKSEEAAAADAVNSARAAGLADAAIWTILPRPLKKLFGSGVQQYGEGTLSRFVANRVAGASAGGIVGGTSQAAKNLATGDPLDQGVVASGLSTAALFGPEPMPDYVDSAAKMEERFANARQSQAGAAAPAKSAPVLAVADQIRPVAPATAAALEEIVPEKTPTPKDTLNEIQNAPAIEETAPAPSAVDVPAGSPETQGDAGRTLEAAGQGEVAPDASLLFRQRRPGSPRPEPPADIAPTEVLPPEPEPQEGGAADALRKILERAGKRVNSESEGQQILDEAHEAGRTVPQVINDFVDTGLAALPPDAQTRTLKYILRDVGLYDPTNPSLELLHDYFQPGRKLANGDTVVAFHPPAGSHQWSVTVQDQYGTRNHMTIPEMRHLVQVLGPERIKAFQRGQLDKAMLTPKHELRGWLHNSVDADSIDDLQGTSRGLVAVMEAANRRAKQASEALPAPAPKQLAAPAPTAKQISGLNDTQKRTLFTLRHRELSNAAVPDHPWKRTTARNSLGKEKARRAMDGMGLTTENGGKLTERGRAVADKLHAEVAALNKVDEPESQPAPKAGGLTPMMQQYRQLKDAVAKDYPNALVAFRLGDFYEFFFEDAHAAAKAVNITLTNRQGIPMAGIPAHAAQGYFQKMLQAGHQIAIADTPEAPAPGQPAKRKITEVLNGTPKPADTPPQAAAKAAEHIADVKHDMGTRPAKDVKAELIARLEQAIADAPESGGKKITISIPGDGDFTVFNTKSELGEVLKRAKAIQTTKGATKAAEVKTRMDMSGSGKSARLGADADKAVSIYGSENDAIRTLTGQRDTLKERGEDTDGVDSLLQRLWTRKVAQLNHARSLVTAMEKRVAKNQEIAGREKPEGFSAWPAYKRGNWQGANKRATEELAQDEPELAKLKERRDTLEAEYNWLDKVTTKSEAPEPPAVEQVHKFGGGSRRPPAPPAPPAAPAAPPPPPVPTTPAELSAVQRYLTPGLDFVKGTVAGLQSLLLPSSKSPAHLTAAETLGMFLGPMHRDMEAAVHQLRPDSRYFDKLGVHRDGLAPADNPGLQFMSALSQGRVLSPRLQAIADRIARLFEDRLDKLARAGAPLLNVRANYFPGMWTKDSVRAFNQALADAHAAGIIGKEADLNDATDSQKQWVKKRTDELLDSGQGSDKDMLPYFTKKPLKGGESFRKKKVFDDIMTGAEFGLRPVSHNPVDIVLAKLAEMDRSIMANRLFQHLREQDRLRIIDPYAPVPPGWQKLLDKYGTIYGPPTVTLPEYVDHALYNGMLDVAKSLGVTHARVMSAGRGALGWASNNGKMVSQFATELSVLAHELGHQIDFKWDLWDRIVKQAQGLGAKGVPTKSASAVVRGKIQKELRALADLAWEGRDPDTVSSYYKALVRKKAEKMAHMLEAYIHAKDKFRQVAPTVFEKFDAFLKSEPKLEPLTRLQAGLRLEKLESEKYIGLPTLGYRIVPDADADIINNYLSGSLYNNKAFGKPYTAWMGAASALNQAQLGVGSAFHASFTTGEAQISAGANVLKDLYGAMLAGNRSGGDLAGSLKTWLTASWGTAATGDKILNAWRHPDGVMDERIAQVVRAAEMAGGGFKMETGLSTDQWTKAVRDWHSGRQLKAAARSPVAFTELMAKPIMDWLVPRQKAGVFADLAWRIIEQNPGKSLEELAPQFRQAWNRTDARLGQVRYDRLFINNTAKGVIQGLVRAPGWSGGTLAEIGGAFPDLAKFAAEWAKTGKPPENLPDRAAYVLSLLVTAGVVGAALTYAFTGERPKTVLDLYAPRIGKKDKHGNEERILPPTYMKDVLAYSRHPGTTLVNKTHPALVTLDEIFVKNHDFYGYEIRDPHAGAFRQTWQMASYALKAFEPFWIRGALQQKQQEGGAASMVAAYLGIMPAPQYLVAAPMKQQIAELYHLRKGDPVKPYAARDVAPKPHDAATVDIYMFKELPKTDKDWLLGQMTPAERARYNSQ